MMNSGYNDGTKLKYNYAWPTDLMAIERNLPHGERGYRRWNAVAETNDPPRDYYIPGEVCDTIGYHWFAVEGDHPSIRCGVAGDAIALPRAAGQFAPGRPARQARADTAGAHRCADAIAKNVDRFGS